MSPEQFTAWDNALGLRRSVVLFGTLWMTWRAFLWAAAYASAATAPDVATGVVIAAVLAPVSVLQGYVFKAYIGSWPDPPQ